MRQYILKWRIINDELESNSSDDESANETESDNE